MKQIALKHPDSFAKDFLSGFMSGGFGVLPKRDIELLVLRLLEQDGALKNVSNHAAALKLGISETRLKSMRYELAQRYYSDQAGYFESRLKVFLAVAKFDVEEGKISFVVEDTFVRLSLAAKLKEHGRSTDGSFNSEIIRINADSICDVLGEIYDNDSIRPILAQIRDAVKAKEAVTFSKLWKRFINGIPDALAAAAVAAGSS